MPIADAGIDAFRRAFAQRLVSARKGKKFEPKALVARARLGSVQALWHYENGRRIPRPEHLVALADTLEVSLDWLLGTARGALRRQAEIIPRDDEEKHRASLDLWEKDLELRRYTAPHLFDTLILLPEVADWLDIRRRGQVRSADDQARERDRQWRETRLDRFERGSWVEYHLCSLHEVTAFARQQGPYAGLDPKLVVAQLDRALDVLKSFSRRCLVRLTPLMFRFAYRIYDNRRVVLNSIRNYVVFDDPDVVSKFVREFEDVWDHEDSGEPPVTCLQRLREEAIRAANASATSEATRRPPVVQSGKPARNRRRSPR